MTIAEFVRDREISEVVHFTTNRGFVGMLHSGEIKSTRRLGSDEYLQNILHKNAISRPEEAPGFDKSEDWLDFVNMSISAINASYMGFSKKWPHNQDIWWCILSFTPDILSHEGVYFATTNNKYLGCRRATDLAGLEALYAPTVPRQGTWTARRLNRHQRLPTCQQAEVLYPGALPIRFLRHVYVQSGEDADRIRGWLREFNVQDVEVSVDDAAFVGVPN